MHRSAVCVSGYAGHASQAPQETGLSVSDVPRHEFGGAAVAGILWSQQAKLAATAEALAEWQVKAQELGVSVTQINLTLLTDPDEPELGGPMIVFEWDTEHQEYAMRTAGDG